MNNNLRRRIPLTTRNSDAIRPNWIELRSEADLPPYEEEVLLIRPDPTGGPGVMCFGRLVRASQDEPVYYGKIGQERVTWNDYWIIRGKGVWKLESISHWAKKPLGPSTY